MVLVSVGACRGRLEGACRALNNVIESGVGVFVAFKGSYNSLAVEYCCSNPGYSRLDESTAKSSTKDS